MSKKAGNDGFAKPNPTVRIDLAKLASAENSPDGIIKSADEKGYTKNVFLGKAQQMDEVRSDIANKGFLPKELVGIEVEWFYK